MLNIFKLMHFKTSISYYSLSMLLTKFEILRSLSLSYHFSNILHNLKLHRDRFKKIFDIELKIFKEEKI